MTKIKSGDKEDRRDLVVSTGTTAEDIDGDSDDSGGHGDDDEAAASSGGRVDTRTTLAASTSAQPSSFDEED
jgi:hypothetical protein